MLILFKSNDNFAVSIRYTITSQHYKQMNTKHYLQDSCQTVCL